MDGCARSPVTVRLSARSSDGKRASGHAARLVCASVETDGQAVPDCVRRVPGAGVAACGAIGAGTVPTVATSRAAAWPLAAFDLPGETPTAGRLRAFAGDGAAVGAFIRWQTGKRSRIACGAFLGPGVAACGAICAGTVPTVATSRAAAWPFPAAGALPAFDLPGETPTAGRLRAFAGGGAAVEFIRWEKGKLVL